MHSYQAVERRSKIVKQIIGTLSLKSVPELIEDREETSNSPITEAR